MPDVWRSRYIDPGRRRCEVWSSFQIGDQHIDVLELKVALATLRWRTRSTEQRSARSGDLLGLQVPLAVQVRGRSSSLQVQAVLRRLDACTIASSTSAVCVFIKSQDNPADKPSGSISYQGVQ